MNTAVAVAVWVGLAVVVVGLQLAGLATRHRFPTFGDAAAYAMRWWLGRVLLLSGWIWLGWHTFVRSHAG